jgi:thermitase
MSNVTSFGVPKENLWFKQRPFNVHDSNNSSEITQSFAYNGSHVELVIGLKEKEENYEKLASTIAQEKGRIREEIPLESSFPSNLLVSVPTSNVLGLLREIADNDDVEYLEPNWKFHTDTAPNDPGWINQWGPEKIEADTAWNTRKGGNVALVAVVDTGIDYNHRDLRANYVALGYDWVNDDADPMDDNGHGTHVAGIIAATMNNSLGIAGLAQVQVMAEKGFSYNGMGYSDDLANAIIHAANQGARIISCSWGSDEESQLIRNAIKYATRKGALVIAAAGNSGTNTKHYPAAYPEVIAVTATDENDNPAAFTTYGDWVDLAAPGTSIYSTYLWNSYVSMSGTSMACPHVTGVAALVWSQYPMMTAEQVRSQLLNTADDLGEPGVDVFYGYGRVNARKAVAQTIALAGSRLLDAPKNTVYFLNKRPKDSVRPESAYDVIAGGIIYGLTENSQRQIFTSSNQLVLKSGELNTTMISNATVVLFGGPCAQKTVERYERLELAPLKFVANATHFMFQTQSNRTVAALSLTLTDFDHEDMFAMEVFTDGSNLIVIMYGFTWKGTWASGMYFKDVISKDFNAYSESYYVFHWIDDSGQDEVPQSSEIHMETKLSGNL